MCDYSLEECLEEILGAEVVERFVRLTESLGIPDDDAEANMLALDQVLNNLDNDPSDD